MNEDKKLQKKLVNLMFYTQALIQKYEELEQRNIELSQQLLSKKISDKDIEYKKRIEIQQELDQYKNNWEELKKCLIEESKFDEYKDITYRETMGYVLDKMKELEEGK